MAKGIEFTNRIFNFKIAGSSNNLSTSVGNTAHHTSPCIYRLSVISHRAKRSPKYSILFQIQRITLFTLPICHLHRTRTKKDTTDTIIKFLSQSITWPVVQEMINNQGSPYAV